MERTKNTLTEQVKEKVNKPVKVVQEEPYEGNYETMISTGSTLLDLAISGGKVRGGGIPGGILVEVFGPNGSGKTVLLCEIAGNIQRQGGSTLFLDPEARLNKQFASIFGFTVDDTDYSNPDTVTEVFIKTRQWEPSFKGINGIFTDSLAALSTDMEMEKEEGDKMGMRRAKEFSEQLRKTCRILKVKNRLMLCSNQVRINQDAGPYGQKYVAPGGEAMGFYASLRLRASKPEKIKRTKKVEGKDVVRVIGVETEFEVFKSSVWKPYRTAPLYILFDYGIDDVRANLQFIKDYTSNTVYTCNGTNLDKSLDVAIRMIEEDGRENELKECTIDLWEEIEHKFETVRKPKQR